MNIYIQKIRNLSLDNKYTNWYCSIIENALARASIRKEAKRILGYTEGHHILPKSFNFGGEKDQENISYLSAKEHFIVHLLATKMFQDKWFKQKMLRALSSFMRVCKDQKRYLTSAQFEVARKASSIAQANRIITVETRKKLSVAQKGKTTHNKGKKGYKNGPCSPTRAKNISEARKKTRRIVCEFCGTETDPGNHVLYHGISCKHNPNVDIKILIERSRRCRAGAISAKKNGTQKPFAKKLHNTPLTCPHCNKFGTNYGNMMKNHFDRCNKNPLSEWYNKKRPSTARKVSCLFCKTEIDNGNFTQHHGDKCKSRFTCDLVSSEHHLLT